LPCVLPLTQSAIALTCVTEEVEGTYSLSCLPPVCAGLAQVRQQTIVATLESKSEKIQHLNINVRVLWTTNNLHQFRIHQRST
jgi:hypothetical protein